MESVAVRERVRMEWSELVLERKVRWLKEEEETRQKDQREKELPEKKDQSRHTKGNWWPLP